MATPFTRFRNHRATRLTRLSKCGAHTRAGKTGVRRFVLQGKNAAKPANLMLALALLPLPAAGQPA